MNGTINEPISDPKPKVSGKIRPKSQNSNQLYLMCKFSKFRPHQETIMSQLLGTHEINVLEKSKETKRSKKTHFNINKFYV